MEEDTPEKTLGDIALDGAAALGSLMAGVTGEYPALGGYEGIRERIRIGAHMVKDRFKDAALDVGAVVVSSMAGVTGDYASLGGYDGIRTRLEIGLYELSSR